MLYIVMLRRDIERTRNEIAELKERKFSIGITRIQKNAYNLETAWTASDVKDLKKKLVKLQRRLALVKSLGE